MAKTDYQIFNVHRTVYLLSILPCFLGWGLSIMLFLIMLFLIVLVLIVSQDVL